MKKSIIVALVFFILISPTAFTQDITGNIEGKIVDTLEAPLTNVNILIKGEKYSWRRSSNSC
jgi:hypothetical protein